MEKRIATAKRLQYTQEYYFSYKLKQIQQLIEQGQDIINLGIGSPDMPPHPDVIDALSKAAHDTSKHGYQSYRGIPDLRRAFAYWYYAKYNVYLDATHEVLPLIGSKEGIMHLCMTYLDEGDQVLIPNPGYATYRSAVQLASAEPITYSLKEENNWEIDFDALYNIDLQRVKMMWINYPHMPTGTLPSTTLFERIIQFGLEHNILICHDNPYSFILNEHSPLSIFSVSDAKRIAIELNSVSKSHNMAGWRVGVMAASRQYINDVIRFKSNMDSGMFYAVQRAAVKALSLGDSWYKSINVVYAARRKLVFQLLDKLKCTYGAQQAGLFVWARISSGHKDGYTFSDAMLKDYYIFASPGGIFGDAGTQYIRMSLCVSEQVLKKALQRI